MCETQLRAGKLIGKSRKLTSHTEQDIACYFQGGKVVTMVVNANGLIVCRDWKKCKHHGERLIIPGRGVTMCPETQLRELRRKQLEEKQRKQKKPKRIDGMTALLLLSHALQEKLKR